MPPKKKNSAAATGGLQSAIKELRDKQNINIGVFSGFNMTPEGLPMGNITLNALTGIGGVPKGRITEFVGPPSSGKTTAALQTAAETQKNGGIIFFADYERTLDPVYCGSLGLDVTDESFIYMQPAHFEEGANAYRKLVSTGEITLGIFDSVATMVTKHELEADTGAVQVADRAKMLHQFLRQLNPLSAETDTATIFLNHIMELVDASPMGQQMARRGIKRKTSPGGRALPFYSSLRIEFNQIGNVRSKEMDFLNNEEVDQIRQTKTKATVIKNKVADPFGEAELRVRFGHGFSQPFSVLNILTSHKVVKVSTGGWHTFPPEVRLNGDDEFAKIQGQDDVLTLMENNPEWLSTLEKVALKVVEKLGTDTFEKVDGTEFSKAEEALEDFDPETGELP